jgi:predicted DNA-binding antitoxin AbrB/MazE fold protein
MNAYKKYLTIDNSQQLTLSNLPFKPGQKVEVIIIQEDNESTEERLKELQEKIEIGTQQIQTGKVTDGEIVFAQIKEKLHHNYGFE